MNQPKFSDTKGREYFPLLDFVKLRKIRDLGIDLGDIAQIGKTWAALLSNDLKALDVTWLASQRDGITVDDFQAAMNGDTLEAARTALGEALVNFTPPLKRGTMRESLAAVAAAYQEAISEAEKNIQTILNQGLSHALQHGRLPPNVPESLATSTSIGV